MCTTLRGQLGGEFAPGERIGGIVTIPCDGKYKVDYEFWGMPRNDAETGEVIIHAVLNGEKASSSSLVATIHQTLQFVATAIKNFETDAVIPEIPTGISLSVVSSTLPLPEGAMGLISMPAEVQYPDQTFPGFVEIQATRLPDNNIHIARGSFSLPEGAPVMTVEWDETTIEASSVAKPISLKVTTLGEETTYNYGLALERDIATVSGTGFFSSPARMLASTQSIVSNTLWKLNRLTNSFIIDAKEGDVVHLLNASPHHLTAPSGVTSMILSVCPVDKHGPCKKC